MASEPNKPASLLTTASEKAGREHVEIVEYHGLEPKLQLYSPHVDTSDVDEKKLMRKVDMWLIPWLTLLYLLCFLDRASIGNARVRTRLSFLLQQFISLRSAVSYTA